MNLLLTGDRIQLFQMPLGNGITWPARQPMPTWESTRAITATAWARPACRAIRACRNGRPGLSLRRGCRNGLIGGLGRTPERPFHRACLAPLPRGRSAAVANLLPGEHLLSAYDPVEHKRADILIHSAELKAGNGLAPDVIVEDPPATVIASGAGRDHQRQQVLAARMAGLRTWRCVKATAP